jgi:carbon monoxide dehydrogenase subunit G
MKNTYSIEIAAPPAQVFKWVNDGECLKQWVPGLVENEILTTEDGAVGSRFRQIYLENGRRMEMNGRVTRFEENRYLACELVGDMFDLKVDYRFDASNGRTLLTQNSEVLFKSRLMKVVMSILKPFIKASRRKQIDEQFEKLRAFVESDVA